MTSKSIYLALVALAVIGFAGSATAATLTVPGDHSSIQDAIDAASPGDTIEVAPGTYEEEVNVDKKINIVGSSATNRPVLNGVDKTGKGITLQGADGVVLKNLVITNYQDGVYFSISSEAVENLKVENVDSVNNFRYGFVGLSDESGGPDHSDLTFIDVNASYNNDATFYGLFPWGRGIYFKASADSVTVSDSTFQNNGLVGIDFGTSDSDPVTTDHLDIEIENIQTSGNGDVGVALHAVKDAVLSDSTISDGVDLNGDEDTLVTRNNFGDSEDFDIRVRSKYGAGPPANIEISRNNFNAADSLGVTNTVEDFNLDATENYWGHASGPSARTNSAGKQVGHGAGILGDADWSSYLVKPFGQTPVQTSAPPKRGP